VRLEKIRSWLASEHFPESFRIVVQKEITPDAQFALSELARDGQVGTYLHNAHSSLSECDWDVTSINNAICEPAKDIEMDLSDAFTAMYWMFLGMNKGPKLASILVMLSRDEVLQLIANAKSNI
jgi:lysyl-tRNA synthetase class I